MTRFDEVIQQLNNHTSTTFPPTPTNRQVPIASNLTTPSPLVPSNPTLPSSYPVKRLTYSEMQQLRDRGLCLNCNDIDTTSHRCPVKRIVLVLPDEDLNIEQLSMEIHASTIPKQPSSQNISLLALNHDSDPKAMQMELQELADLNSTQFQSAALNSSVARQTDMGITHHQLHTKLACNLDFQFGTSFFLSISVENEENIMRKILCCKNSSWHIELKADDARNMFVEMNKLKLKWDDAPHLFAEMNKLKRESKIFIFDPGGDIFDAKVFFITHVVA